MKVRILKFPVPAQKGFDLDLPPGAKFLAVQVQRGEPQMWFQVEADPDFTGVEEKMVQRAFRCMPTGIVFDDRDMLYLGTFQFEDDHLVFHVYEVTS